MAKPTQLPTWATDPGAQIVEPPAGKPAAGWVPSERVPAQFLNWWQNRVGQWLGYLNNLHTEALRWIPRQEYNNGILVRGGYIRFADTNEDTPAGEPVLPPANLAGLSDLSGLLSRKQVCKAWGVARLNGASAPTLLAGHNVQSVALDVSNTILRITYAMQLQGPCVVVSGYRVAGGTLYVAQPNDGNSSRAGQLEVVMLNTSNGIQPLNTSIFNGVEIHFQAMGTN